MSRNQQKRAQKINPTEVLQSYCGVCFTAFQKKPPRKLNQGLDALVCTKCKCMTHQTCYSFDVNSTLIGEGVRQFLCDKCSQGGKAKVSCVVCHGIDGVMKLLQGGQKQFIHVFCGLTHNEVDVAGYYPALQFRKTPFFGSDQQAAKIICEVCGQIGADDKCAEESCHSKVHTYCAQSQYQKCQEQDEIKSWKFSISIGQSSEFDLRPQPIKQEWFKDQTEIAVQNLQDFESVPKPNKEQIRAKIFGEYEPQAIKDRLSVKKLRRGGYQFVLCSNHGGQFFCICSSNGVIEGTGDMVLCECCFEWYHQACVKYSPKGEEAYVCQECKEFYDFKRKLVQEIRNNKVENYQIKWDLPHKISLMDLMWVLRVIDSRLGAGGVSSKLVKLISKFPIKSSRIDMIVKNQNRGKLGQLTDQFLIEYLKNQLGKIQPLAVLALDQERRPVTLYQNIQKNRRVKQYVLFARTFCKNNHLPDIYQSLLSTLDFKEDAISDQYEKILNLSQSPYHYPEIEVLKVKAEAYSFMEIIKRVDTGSIIQFQDLQTAVDKAKTAPGVPRYLLTPLLERFQKGKQLVNQIILEIKNNPETLQSLDQKTKALAQLKISPPLSYKKFKVQLKLLNDLYLLYLKESGNQLNLKKSAFEKVEQLKTETVIKGTKSLSQIMNSYEGGSEEMIIPGLSIVFDKYSLFTIQYQIKQALSNNSIEFDKLQKLLQRDKPFFHPHYSESVGKFVQTWFQIKNKCQNVLNKDLTEVDQVEAISKVSDQVKAALSALAELPIAIDSAQKGNPYGNRLMKRKQELSHLMIIYTESQLAKNPFTIPKLVHNLPKNNKLVKNFYSLKKEYDTMIEKYNRILRKAAQKINSFKVNPKRPRKDQIKEIAEKPNIVEVTELIEQLTAHKIDFKAQIQRLTSAINSSLEIASAVKKFESSLPNPTFQNCNDINELNNARKEIQEIRKRVMTVAQLNLKDEFVTLYHLEIYSRIKQMLLSPTIDLQKINKALKLAEEEQLTQNASYIQLKNNYRAKTQTKEELATIQHLQQQLSSKAEKDKDFLYQNLQNFRRGLRLPQITDRSKTGKDDLIDSLTEKNKALRKKIDNVLQKNPSKYDFNEAKTLFYEALRNPYSLPKISMLSSELQKFYKLQQKWREGGSKPTSSKAMFFNSYDELLFTNQEVEEMRASLKVTQQALEELEVLSKDPNMDSSYKLQEIMDNLEAQNHIKDTIVYEQAKIKYVRYWLTILQECSLNKSGFIPYQKIKRLLIQSYLILQNMLKRNENPESMRQPVLKLERVMQEIVTYFKNKPIEQTVQMIDGYIDVEDLYFELQTVDSIEEQLTILYPFRDLSAFKYKPILKINREPERDLEDNVKRSRPADQRFFQNDPMEEDKDRNVFKNIKPNQQNDSPSDPDNKSPEHVSQTVTDVQRRKIKQIILKNMKKNPDLGTDLEEYVKILENQIFGSYYNNVIKYLQSSDKYQKLFIKLQSCPKISNRLAKKKFQLPFIELLVQNLNSINDYENMMPQKNQKDEKPKTVEKKENTDHKRQQGPMANSKSSKTPDEDERDANNMLDMLASGKIDDSLKKDMKKEIKAVKQSSKSHHRDSYRDHKQSRHKKKKHHRHRSRSRSRSKSPQKDAKFSSASEEELPAYIRQEYNRQLPGSSRGAISDMPTWQHDDPPMYMTSMGSANQAPLMYDPDAELEEQVVYYPKGTVLKLKEVTVEFYLKKKEKNEFKTILFTDQDHKKIINELVDPEFNRVSIKREKDEEQIISYLNKPSKKKYKYLVSWLQATTDKENQLLRDFAIESSDRRKIYGLQNEHVKMHIMSIRQFIKIHRFHSPPYRVTKQSTSKILKDDRIVCIIQYPAEKMYDLKELFPNFKNIEKVDSVYDVGVPIEMPPQQVMPAFSNIMPNLPHIPNLNMNMQAEIDPTFGMIMNYQGPERSHQLMMGQNNLSMQREVEYQGWGTANESSQSTFFSQNIIDSTNIFTSGNSGTTKNSSFSPILSQEEDNGKQRQDNNSKNDKDFVSNLLSSIGDINLKNATQSLSNAGNSGGGNNLSLGGMYGRDERYQNYQSRSSQSLDIRWAGSNYPGNTSGHASHNPMAPHPPPQMYNPMAPLTKYTQNNMMFKNPMSSYSGPTIRDNRHGHNYGNQARPFYQGQSQQINPMQYRPPQHHLTQQHHGQGQGQGNQNQVQGQGQSNPYDNRGYPYDRSRQYGPQ